jgi:threonine dehydrogenase-like Zn-dependent dehydrogenase
MGQVNPAEVLTQTEPIISAIEAYKLFDRRAPGWVKVELKPAVAALAQSARL